MKIIGKKLILGAMPISALTIIGASADQAQAKMSGCKGQTVCGNHKNAGGGRVIDSPITIAGIPARLTSKACLITNLKTLALVNGVEAKVKSWRRCPMTTWDETKKASKELYDRFFSGG